MAGVSEESRLAATKQTKGTKADMFATGRSSCVSSNSFRPHNPGKQMALKIPHFPEKKTEASVCLGSHSWYGHLGFKTGTAFAPLLACFSRGLLRRRQSWTHALSLSEEVFEAIRFLSRLITDPCEISHAEPGSQQALDSSAHISLAEVSSEGSAGLRIPASLPLAGSSEHNSAHPTNE